MHNLPRNRLSLIVSGLNCRSSRTAAVAVLLTGFGLAQTLDVDRVVETVVKKRLSSGEVKPRQRQAAIRDLFTEVGCSVEEQPIDKSSGNVICTLPGQTNSTIVVGGHFDFVDRGRGIVDDWSGVSLLPSLYESLKNRPRQHTYVFVAFAGEERGLVGSSRYVKKLTPDQKARIRAFVNLECLGLTPVKVWVHRSTPALVARLIEVARAINTSLQGVDVERVGDDDTHPFFLAHIPVISIHSVTQETFQILHTVRDRLDAIHFDDYYAAYKLAAFIWHTWM
jgi:Zn-dependent M28 family amino/carboxypeptidase